MTTAPREEIETQQTAGSERETTGTGAQAEEGDYNIGSLEQIPPGEGRRFLIAGHHIAVFRARNGGIYATQAECPHKAGPLIDGLLGGSVLVCPLHAWKWELATGQPLMGECALTTYPVRLTPDGEIIVQIISG